jgi:16S rRNA (uracil1498-N3)-methyltransferase
VADSTPRAHVFVVDLEAPELDVDDRHHVERVLRLRPGDELTASDGAGAWRRFRLGPVLEPVGAVHRDPAPEPVLTVAFALTKGDRPEWTVQKLTELGIDRIVPFAAQRSVVRWDGGGAGETKVERLRRVARQAAMQSRRSRLPEVEGLTSFADLAARPGAALADRAGESPSLAWPMMLVGPEGGWSPEEEGSGLARVALGPQVLRAETAAVATGAVLAAMRAGLVRDARS